MFYEVDSTVFVDSHDRFVRVGSGPATGTLKPRPCGFALYTVVIGGLCIATVLTLFLLPIFYERLFTKSASNRY